MHRIAKFTALGLCIIVWSVCGSPSQADLVNWNIDASQSFIQLTIPQQSVTTTSGTFDIRIRNQTGSSSTWNVGNKAFIDGTLTTSYALGDTDIRIMGGQSTIQGLNSGSFDPLSSPAGAEGTAPAVYGGKAQADLPIFGWDDAAFVALRNVLFDAATATALPITAGNFDSTAVQIGVADGEAAYRGVGLAGGSIGSGVEAFPPFLAANTAAGGTITTPNPMIPAQQRLTVPVNIPVTLDLGGVIVTGTATGTIVANAVVPAANDRVAAGNIAVLGPADPPTNTNDGVNVPQTGSPAVSVLRSNAGDYQIAVGGAGLEYKDGVLLASVRQNLRDGIRASVEAGRNSFNDGIVSLSIMQAGYSPNANGTNEVNFDTSVAWFPFAGNWRGGHVEAGTGALIAANGVDAGMLTQTVAGTGRYSLNLGVDSHDQGMLFAIGSANQDNVVNTGVLADHSGWDIRVTDNAWNFTGNGGNGEDSDYSFVYIPYATDGLIGGRYDGINDTHLKSVGSFTITKLGTGQYKLTISGESPDTGMLMLTTSYETSSGGITGPDDNVLTYESDGLGSFLINSYDLPNISFQNTQFVWAFIDFADPISDPPLPIPGDVNFDGAVDIFDINLISAHWGEVGPTADANHDGAVDIFDVNMVSANWTGAGSAGAAAAVPEPSTFVLLGAAGLLLVVRGRICSRSQASAGLSDLSALTWQFANPRHTGGSVVARNAL